MSTHHSSKTEQLLHDIFEGKDEPVTEPVKQMTSAEAALHQWSRLDARLGRGVGAYRERTRLAKVMGKNVQLNKVDGQVVLILIEGVKL